MSNRQYHDLDGNEVTLEALCRREPEWAANRIRARDRELRELLGHFRDIMDAPDERKGYKPFAEGRDSGLRYAIDHIERLLGDSDDQE